jgi:hypothetical protein
MTGRNEEFFYHGTNAEIKPGEVIKPAAERGGEAISHYEADVYKDHPNYAYATPHLSMAQGFAARAVERNGGTGRVYRVGRNWGHPKSVIWKNPWGDEARSEGGFVVHEELPYEEPETRKETDT